MGHVSETATVKIGILNDVSDAANAHTVSPADMAEWIERAMNAHPILSRSRASVEFVHAYALGFPSGTAEAVEQAYRQLAQSGVSLIVGPAIDENALIVTPIADAMRIPTLTWGHTERARSRYMFQMQAGCASEEARVIAAHYAANHLTQVAVIHDMSPQGMRRFEALRRECRLAGIDTVAHCALAADNDAWQDSLVSLLAQIPAEAVATTALTWLDGVYAVGMENGDIAKALQDAGWGGFVMTNKTLKPDEKACEGWYHLDLISENNAHLRELMTETGLSSPHLASAARGHDLGSIVAEAIARASDFHPDGLRIALEDVRGLPAAQGAEGTVLSFGPYDHAALHGQYLHVYHYRNGRPHEIQSPSRPAIRA